MISKLATLSYHGGWHGNLCGSSKGSTVGKLMTWIHPDRVMVDCDSMSPELTRVRYK
jgi:hypothetical protein